MMMVVKARAVKAVKSGLKSGSALGGIAGGMFGKGSGGGSLSTGGGKGFTPYSSMSQVQLIGIIHKLRRRIAWYKGF